MITVKTSHNHIWMPECVTADIIKEYQQTGRAIINLNAEGPCASSVGLYNLLDQIVGKFGFNKKQIIIQTGNREEVHPEYTIRKQNINAWAKQTYKTAINNGFAPEEFRACKTLKNRFGCMYNIPSWNRLLLLSHIRYKTTNQSLLACNGTWESAQHNSIYLNPVTDFCPEEFPNIFKLLIDGIDPLPEHPGHKPDEVENTKVLKFYNDFFVDVVAETYTNGLTFFPTEKTFRPIFGFTPFIIFGPQGFLSTLKSDYNFLSFDAWWDESYDNYQNYERIQKMYEVIEYIDSLSDSKISKIYNEMLPVLEHNFTQLKMFK